MILTPTVDTSRLGDRQAKAITYVRLNDRTLDFLNSMRSQKLSKGTWAPQEQALLLLWNWCTKASCSNKLHWYMRDFFDDFKRVRLISSAISELPIIIFSTTVNHALMVQD